MKEKDIEVGKDSSSNNKTFDFHKVFAAIGVILVVAITILAGVWYFTIGKNTQLFNDEENTVKVSTSSAKVATNSATHSATKSADK